MRYACNAPAHAIDTKLFWLQVDSIVLLLPPLPLLPLMPLVGGCVGGWCRT